MAEFTPRFCYETEKEDFKDEQFYLRGKSNSKIKKSKHKQKKHNHHKSLLDKKYVKSNTKDIFKENLIRQIAIKKFFDSEFDPEKDYEQFINKRFLLSKIQAFNDQNLDNEELLK